MTIEGYAEKWNAMCGEAEVALENIVQEQENTMTEMQRTRLFSGKNADGTDIIPQYADMTIFHKALHGQPTDRVTLKDTGAFYRGIFANVIFGSIEIDSTDKKSEKLKEKYGESIFGLTDENKSMLNHAIIAEFVRWIKSKI